MSHWRSGTFWASTVFGWFVTAFALAFMIAIVGPEQLTAAEAIAVDAAYLLLSLAAGYAYGRRQFELRKPRQVGFPVITKGEGHSAADDQTAAQPAHDDGGLTR